MKTCYIYSFLAPIDDEEFKDNNDIPPLGTIPITRGTAPTREAAILGTPNRVKAFRLAIPDKEGDTLDPADLRKFFKYRKLMLDSIRLAYDPSAEFYRQDDEVFYAYNFTDAGEGPNLGLRIAEELNPDYRVNVEGIRRLFAVPVSLRPIIHLLADGSAARSGTDAGRPPYGRSPAGIPPGGAGVPWRASGPRSTGAASPAWGRLPPPANR